MVFQPLSSRAPCLPLKAALSEGAWLVRKCLAVSDERCRASSVQDQSKATCKIRVQGSVRDSVSSRAETRPKVSVASVTAE